ncbi:MAG: hypothetical protein BMS9Abin29_2386 [Gemmatimonadota bacterium]|nr:MAG: hypothetical protein BMS9Abin29_2386 [Gemmatimonadota bacterium]
MLVDTRRRNAARLSFTILVGMVLGGLMTKLSEWFLPEGPARTFLTTAVAGTVGPFSIDLVAVAFTLGPLDVRLNVLTLVGIAIVGFVVRSWI